MVRRTSSCLVHFIWRNINEPAGRNRKYEISLTSSWCARCKSLRRDYSLSDISDTAQQVLNGELLEQRPHAAGIEECKGSTAGNQVAVGGEKDDFNGGAVTLHVSVVSGSECSIVPLSFPTAGDVQEVRILFTWLRGEPCFFSYGHLTMCHIQLVLSSNMFAARVITIETVL